jgi:hypothetical protein
VLLVFFYAAAGATAAGLPLWLLLPLLLLINTNCIKMKNPEKTLPAKRKQAKPLRHYFINF